MIRRNPVTWVGFVIAALAWPVAGWLVGTGQAELWVAGAIALVAGLGLPALLWFAGMETRVDEEGVRVRYAPFVSFAWSIDEVERAEAVEYRPLLECLGWGLRWSPKYGRVLTVAGRRGVVLNVSGRRWLVGSEDPIRLERSINRAIARAKG